MDQRNIKTEDVAAPSAAVASNGVATAALTPALVGDANKRPAPVGNGSLAPVSKKPNTAAVGTTASQKSQLQQQIQQQLQQQLQAQLQAAAARGQQANITPEQIQVRVYLYVRNLLLFLHSFFERP